MIKMHKLLCLVFVTVLLIGCKQKSKAQAIEVKETFKNIPVLDRPINPKNAVNDFANVFTVEEKMGLERKLRKFYDTTSNEFVIVTLKNVDSFDVADVAMAYCKKWRFGRKEKNNGLLILLSLQPKQIRINTGLGLEDVLTDSICAKVIQETVVPSLKSGNFFNAFDMGTNELMFYSRNKFIN